MPLSKARMRERKRADRANVKPKPYNVKPNIYLQAHLIMCPDYDPVKPNDHCPFINPLLRFPLAHLPNCPDGRYRP